MMFIIRHLEEFYHSFTHEKGLVLFPHRLITYLPGYLTYRHKAFDTVDMDPYFAADSSSLVQSKGKELESAHLSCCSDTLNCTTR